MRDVISVARQVAFASEQRLAYMYMPSVKRRPLERPASARAMKGRDNNLIGRMEKTEITVQD
jgi:hypothetical protein